MLEICYISLLGGERNRRGVREKNISRSGFLKVRFIIMILHFLSDPTFQGWKSTSTKFQEHFIGPQIWVRQWETFTFSRDWRSLNNSDTFPGAQTHLLLLWCLQHLSKLSTSGHFGARNVLFVLCFFITQFSGISSITREFNAFTGISGVFPLRHTCYKLSRLDHKRGWWSWPSSGCLPHDASGWNTLGLNRF